MYVLYAIQTMFFLQLVSEPGIQFRICLTCFESFGIKDSNFMMLEDSTINILHGYWNYCLIKADIDVMMLFKFDIKYVRLNFKAIASMKFSFDLNLILIWSRNYVLLKWNVKNGCQKNLKKFQFHEFRSIENSLRGIENQLSHLETLWWISSIFRSIDWDSFYRTGFDSRSSHPETLKSWCIDS